MINVLIVQLNVPHIRLFVALLYMQDRNVLIVQSKLTVV
jgi:hypothetical protein